MRDLKSKTADEDLVDKVLKMNVKLAYDDQYLRELGKQYSSQVLPISNARLRDTFEFYTT